MSSQVAGARTHSRIGVAFVTLVLACSVIVLATQATSIWSSRGDAQVQPAPVHVSLSAKELNDLSKGATLPVGCRVKYGCLPNRGSNAEPLNGSDIPSGCLVKFGCQPEASVRSGP